MLFNSNEFLLAFLPLALLGYIALRRISGNAHIYIWLTLCSLFFYCWWMPSMSWLIMGSIVVNFVIGRILTTRLTKRPKILLVAGIALNLIPLFYYKYAAFTFGVVASLFGSDATLDRLILPLGISFFTFQQLAFLVDAYKGEAKKYGFFEYSTFVTFFPQLIAGPIVHHGEMMPQFEGRRPSLYAENFAIGGSIFIIGLFKKVIIADALAKLATPVFTGAQIAPVDFMSAWKGSLAYTFQLYFDFSGYSDMAVGLARLFGITLPVNFLSPYKATSMVEFWRRWHITLSRFLRDYIYIPLGGNREGAAKRYLYLMITMLIGGVWHGAGWTFIFWGGLHGAYLVINHLWNRLSGSARQEKPMWRHCLAWALTFLCVVNGWVFFRADSFSSALEMIKGMFLLNGLSGPTTGFWQIGVAALICLIGKNIADMFSTYEPVLRQAGPQKVERSIRFTPSTAWAVAMGALLYFSIVEITGSHSSEFLYFNF